jgi:hypothetical protein
VKGRPARIDASDFKRGIDSLKQKFSPEDVMSATRLVCEQILSEAVESPVPSDTGLLENSATVTRTSQTEWSFGFNSTYAAFQDQPNVTGTGTVTVVPNPASGKKFLYVPISSRGRKDHYYGNNPKDEGLVRGVDYVLKRFVQIQIKSYGSSLGPNHYFSGTWRRWPATRVEEAIGKVLAARFGGGSRSRKR